MKITERIRRLNTDFILYEITTEDPVILTRPWTARFPVKLDNSYQVVGIQLPRRQHRHSQLHHHLALRTRAKGEGSQVGGLQAARRRVRL
jgi:hypothetical protein